MKALIFGALWLLPGVALALKRTSLGAGERLLSALFWPFFLFGGEAESPPPAEAAPTGPLGRLHRALGADDAAMVVVRELQQAVGRLEERLSRVEGAISELAPTEGLPTGGSLAAARARSAGLLREARITCQEELDAALAAVEETATRLVLARETGSGSEVRELLGALRARLHAAEEVAGMEPEAGLLEEEQAVSPADAGAGDDPPELRVVG